MLFFKVYLLFFTSLQNVWSATNVVNPYPTSNVKGTWFDRIVVVVLENGEYKKMAKYPTFKDLAGKGRLLTNYYGVGSQTSSQGTYISMIAGSDMGVKDDYAHNLQGEMIADKLEAAGVSWGLVAENYPTQAGPGCFTGRSVNASEPSTTPLYVRKHNPFISFQSVSNNINRCSAHIHNDDELDDIIQNHQFSQVSLPQVMFYVPNMLNNLALLRTEYSDTFIPRLIDKFNQDAFQKDGMRNLFLFTFDEASELEKTDNHVFATMYGDSITPGQKDNRRFNHYSIPATILANWGLDSMGRNDANAATFF